MSSMAVLYGKAHALFLLEGLKSYKDTQMKAYDITKLTDELIRDNTQK